MTTLPAKNRIACVGAIVRGEAGELLLVQRGHEPAAGSWSLPGGRVEAGESDAAALTRELREETGLEVRVGRLVGVVERAGSRNTVYVIRDYECFVNGGELSPGTDAADARWVGLDEVDILSCSPGLVETLTTWGVLTRRGDDDAVGSR